MKLFKSNNKEIIIHSLSTTIFIRSAQCTLDQARQKMI